jgi:hypothetical protein
MIKNLKNNKSPGIDSIPYELFKYNEIRKILFNMYSKCFMQGKIPSTWRRAIIAPIPKSGNRDQHVPLNYRGISLLSCVSKGFTNILNSRLSSYYETHNLLADEQNGFRPGRTCIDHIFSLTSLIRNRLVNKVDTFCCFIDFQKAFDFVDRELLLYKLLLDNVNGKFYQVIKCIYDSTLASIRINRNYTNWFNINFGVRQGDALSTTLFAIYINDLAKEINDLNCGIGINDSAVSCLFYADDIVLISDSAANLQKQIQCVYNWCNNWKMSINVEKTKVVHFRPKRKSMSTFDFKIGNSDIEIAKHYKYLGIMMDEFLNFETTVELLAGAANRALGSIISKFNNIRNVGYKTFKKLYHTNICPILDYSSGVWGFKKYKSCDKVQYRAIRYYLGVHNKAPLLSLQGDMGWAESNDRHIVEMFRLWNRFIKLEDGSITKKIFLWDKQNCNQNWSAEVKQILDKIGMSECFHECRIVDLKIVMSKLNEINLSRWKDEIQNKPKLRTYILFKDDLETAMYVKYCENRRRRSLIAQFRSGILQLNIELGRFRNISLENRLCEMCNHGVIENEMHFLCECPAYELNRQSMYNSISHKSPDFEQYTNENKFIHIMKYEWKHLGRYLHSAWDIRSTILYR